MVSVRAVLLVFVQLVIRCKERSGAMQLWGQGLDGYLLG